MEELLGVGIEIEVVQMARVDKVQLVALEEREIISETDLSILEQLQHLLLSQGGEEEAEFNLVIAVSGVEQHLEIVVAHQRVLRFVLEIAGKILQFAEGALFPPIVDQSAILAGET